MKKGIIAAGIICLMLSGCGKKDKVEDDFSNVQGIDVATESDGETNPVEISAGEAEHKVEFTVENAKEGFEMTADLVIDTRIPENITTIKVKQVTVDDEYLTSISKQIFDGGEYEVLKVKGYSLDESDSMMLGMMDALEGKVEEFGGVFEPSEYYRYLSAGQESSGAGESSEGQVVFSDSVEIEDGGDSYVCYEEKAFIKGNIDGEPFIMEYTKKDYEPNSEMYMDFEDIMIYPMSGRQIYLGLNQEESETDRHEDNMVSYGDALSTAEKCIQQLGLDSYSLTTTFDMLNDTKSKGIRDLDGKMISGELVNVSPNDYIKKGYRFIFTPAIDGMKLSYCAGTSRTTMEYDFDCELKQSWLQPVVQIDVDATGIRGICINRVYELEENLSSDSQLISFEKANEIAKQMYSETYVEQYTVGDIQLEYIIIQYDDETVMVPAWVYYREGKSGLKFAVNALDGSIVHFGFNAQSYIRYLK